MKTIDELIEFCRENPHSATIVIPFRDPKTMVTFAQAADGRHPTYRTFEVTNPFYRSVARATWLDRAFGRKKHR